MNENNIVSRKTNSSSWSQAKVKGNPLENVIFPGSPIRLVCTQAMGRWLLFTAVAAVYFGTQRYVHGTSKIISHTMDEGDLATQART